MLHRHAPICFIFRQQINYSNPGASSPTFALSPPGRRKGVTELLHICCRHERQARYLRFARACLAGARYSLLSIQECQIFLEFDRMIMAWPGPTTSKARLHFYIPGCRSDGWPTARVASWWLTANYLPIRT